MNNNVSIGSELRLVLLTVSIFVLSTLFVTNANAGELELTPRIVGGSTVAEGQYPFMTAVYFDSDGDGIFIPGCGGSLIANRWVLTAAHCVYDADTGLVNAVSTVAVVVGANDLISNDKELILSRNIIVYPGYDPAIKHADIALIELSSAVAGNVLAIPSNLSTVPIVGETAVVAGWGTTSEGGDQSPNLLEVALPVLSHVQCLPYYPGTLDVNANVCAGGGVTGGSDACQGDSGGPLFVIRDGIYVLAGVVSYGEGCARPGIPGVYTRATNYTDWVSGIVGDAVVVTSDPSEDTTTDQVGDVDIPLLTSTTPLEDRMDSLLSGEVKLYEVTGSLRIELSSLSGDADLFIFEGTAFTEEDIICISINETPLDNCVLEQTSERLFAAIFGYVDSSYAIAVIGPDDDEVSNPEIPVDTGQVPGAGTPVVQVPADDTTDSGGGSAGYWLLLFLAGFKWRRVRYNHQ